MVKKISLWWRVLTKFQKLWIVGAPLLVLLLGIISGDTPINILIGFSGCLYVAVYTSATRYNFILAIIYVSLYTIICLQNRIMLDALQNVILIPIYIASFIRWGKHKVTPSNMTKQQRVLSALLLVVTIGILFILSKVLHGNYSWMDAINSSCTIFAMVFGYFGLSEAWLAWSINNLVSLATFTLVLFTPTGSFAVWLMKLIFAINGAYGYYNFRKIGKLKEVK